MSVVGRINVRFRRKVSPDKVYFGHCKAKSVVPKFMDGYSLPNPDRPQSKEEQAQAQALDRRVKVKPGLFIFLYCLFICILLAVFGGLKARMESEKVIHNEAIDRRLNSGL